MIVLTCDEAKVVVHDLMQRKGGMAAMLASQSAQFVEDYYSIGLRLCVDDRAPLGNMIKDARERREEQPA